MKTLIAIPCMDQVATGFCQSLACLTKVGECAVTHQCSSLIYDSRNAIAKRAIQMEADYVMWFDSDMIFEPDTLQRLMKHMETKDIVSGLYCRRAGSYEPVLFSKLNVDEKGDADWDGYNDYPSEIFEVEGIGFGCVLMKVDVLLDMAAKFGDWFTPLGHFGEDLAFCIRARELGYKIWCDPTIQCGHVGHTIITPEFYRSYRKAGEMHEG